MIIYRSIVLHYYTIRTASGGFAPSLQRHCEPLPLDPLGDFLFTHYTPATAFEIKV